MIGNGRVQTAAIATQAKYFGFLAVAVEVDAMATHYFCASQFSSSCAVVSKLVMKNRAM